MSSAFPLPSSAFPRRCSRRGVLLLVVLSMLVLFMLIGTAFLMSSSQYRKSSKDSSKLNRVGNFPTDLLDRGLMTVLRDTENPRSAVRYHSLLRDMYGTDGFEAVIYSPPANDDFDPFDAETQVTRFAEATPEIPPTQIRESLGPTQGQLIDIYVRELAFRTDDPLTPSPINEGSGQSALAKPDVRHVLKLERDASGRPKMHFLPLTRGYYNGCLLTITSGPARGQTTRIVDYEYVGDINNTGTPFSVPPYPLKETTRLFRFRVMAFPRSDGTPLQVDISPSPSHNPELTDLAGATIIVNGRPFSGTGVGYNPLAPVATPRLSALEKIRIGSATRIYLPAALLPNSNYFFPTVTSGNFDDDSTPFGVYTEDVPGSMTYTPLNPVDPTVVAVADRPLLWKYQHYSGLGDANESYDAADFQNMFLALQTVTPRARGRVVWPDSFDADQLPDRIEVDRDIDSDGEPDVYQQKINFLRLDLEDLPLPSFHRPALINYWYHWLLDAPFLSSLNPNDRVRAILGDPTYLATLRASAPEIAGQLAAVKRRISLRPIREDHPNFTGSNPSSVPSDLPTANLLRNNNINIPYWEVVGPWDVDNDNDGVPDSVWVDLGEPVQQAEDGTLYKPLYAFLIMDLDSRLNVNAHGLVDDLQSPNFDPTMAPFRFQEGNLANDLSAADLNSSNFLPQGLGYGPAEISLRPVFPLPSDPASIGNRSEVAGLPEIDSYATLMAGRIRADNDDVTGRYGLDPMADNMAATLIHEARPGITSISPALGTYGPPGMLTMMKFVGYPWYVRQYDTMSFAPSPSAFATPPDLMCRYSLGLDYAGQPVYEYVYESTDYPLLPDAPYEIDLSSSRRRDVRSDRALMRFNPTTGETEYLDPTLAPMFSVPGWVAAADTDDAPFATAELERILRAFDADAGAVPSRLWDVVGAFDPLQLLLDRGITSPNSLDLVDAQQQTAVNRRLVTTDSYDLPVAAQNMPAYVRAPDPDLVADLGADPEEPEEVFFLLTGRELSRATIVDLLAYRMQQERFKTYGPYVVGTNPNGALDPSDPQQRALLEQLVGQLAQQLLPPEIIAGQRMDLNRPFGDGRDNGDGLDNDGDMVIDEPDEAQYALDPDRLLNGIVDEPFEAGEPFLDISGNGKWEPGEPFIDVLPGDNSSPGSPYAGYDYDGPRDQLWQDFAAEKIAFDYTNGHGEPIHPAVATALGSNGVVRNLDSQARQLYARHLYCLMMLLMDEGYAETPNVPTLGGDNFNLEFYLEAIAAANGNLTPTDQDKEEAVRKLTARRIAQWAVNCVDFRDSDAIMTAFEYDENPWDGWGTVDTSDPDNPVLIPLDGDLATDENKGQVIDWNRVPQGRDTTTNADNNSRVVAPSAEVPVPGFSPLHMLPAIPALVGEPALVNQTRGVVWGVERPELLITETLAFHDRRCTDEGGSGGVPTNLSIFDEPGENQLPDYDLDQRLKPRGSLFVELYNPWSPDGQKPAELYGKPAGSPALAEEGVMLNRLSDVGVTVQEGPVQVVKRSPVWRLAVLQDPINGQLTNQIIEVNDPADEEEVQASQVLSTDPDGFGLDMDQHSERWVYFTTGGDGNRSDDNYIAADGLIAEYDLEKLPTNSRYLSPEMDNLEVWVPPRPYLWTQNPQNKQDEPYAKARRYFIARTERVPNTTNQNDIDVPIAPILPGRYAVVGPSGLQLTGTGISGSDTPSTKDGEVTTRFVTPMSRLKDNETINNPDRLARQTLNVTRRIELWPSIDPEVQQLLIGENGGQECVTLDGTNYVNVTDSSGGVGTGPDGVPDANVVAPAVAIPIEDLNISEPVEGYPSLRYQREYYERNEAPLSLEPAKLSTQGELEYDTPYDRPLDMEFDLVRNGTTQNYRSIHLQRLANPMLPWNPLPYDADGNANPLHQPNLPINPYRTIDSQSVDLTAYNGASVYERSELPTEAASRDSGLASAQLEQDLTQEDYFSPFPAGKFADAPDHVLWALIYVLRNAGISVPDDASTPQGLRAMIAADEAGVAQLLDQLEGAREGNTQDRAVFLNETRTDEHSRDWGGDWGWHLYRRVLPDDQLSDNPRITGSFHQRLHMKSLERGAHYLKYYPENYWDPETQAVTTDEGWGADTSWVPRLLWKQERPNVLLFVKPFVPLGMPAEPTIRVSNLTNVRSRRVLQGKGIIPQDDFSADDVRRSQALSTQLNFQEHVFDFVLEQTLGFANEAYVPELDRIGGDAVAMMTNLEPGAPEIVTNGLDQPEAVELEAVAPDIDELRQTDPPADRLFDGIDQNGNPIPQPPALDKWIFTPARELDRRATLANSTYPWLTWNNRPYVSAEEIMQVPADSSSLMLRDYSAINRLTPNSYDGSGLVDDGTGNLVLMAPAARIARQQSPFGHLLNFFMTWLAPAQTTPPGGSAVELTGAPHYYRILDYVQVPSRYVGTETTFTPEVFNDDPTKASSPMDLDDIASPADPRYNFQPPFNKVSRERDPGKVNLNTVVGRRVPDPNGVAPPQIWSEVYDGIMHRYGDGNTIDSMGNLLQLGHLGPAWRDVVLSRKGYAQYNADDPGWDSPLEKRSSAAPPDVFTFGLNRGFPTVFANPFRSPDAGDLVPLVQMMQYGVDASWLRVHPRNLGRNGVWGNAGDDDGDGLADDMRDAGFGDDDISHRGPGVFRAIPEEEFDLHDDRSFNPLFSETAPVPSIDPYRNPYMMYQPMTRLGNLVTTRSNVYAIWVTVGYFEVEPAPEWNHTDAAERLEIRQRFGGNNTDTDSATIAAKELYDRVYPEGYMLGPELGIDTGDVRRERAFYIIDRTLPVGFKPGEDLNVENMILVRRRIE